MLQPWKILLAAVCGIECNSLFRTDGIDPSRFLVSAFLPAIAIIGILVGLLMPAIQAAREAARRMSCSNNIRQVELAFQNHHSALNHFPGNVRPLATNTLRVRWATHLLPYIEQNSLYQRIDLTKNWSDITPNGGTGGPLNYDLFGTRISLFECPSSPSGGQILDGAPDAPSPIWQQRVANSGIGLSNIAAHEHALIHDATQRLSEIPGLRIIGTAREKVSVISFVLDGHLTEDIGKALDRAGIAVRSGHHCAQPSLRRFGVETTVRPSFSIYNTHDEVSRLVAVVRSLARK